MDIMKSENVEIQYNARAGRLEFAVKSFLVFALVLGTGFFAARVLPRGGDTLGPKIAIFAIAFFWLCLSVMWLFLVVKRLHDFGQTGWWLLAYIVFQNVARNLVGAAPMGAARDICDWIETAVELAALVLVFCWPGDRARNKYGDPPKYPPTLWRR